MIAAAVASSLLALKRRPLGRHGLELVSWLTMAALAVVGGAFVGWSMRVALAASGAALATTTQAVREAEFGLAAMVPVAVYLALVAILILVLYIALLGLVALSIRALRQPGVRAWFECRRAV